MNTTTSELSREEIHPFVGDLCRDLGKVSTRFVEDIIVGISRSHSVRLTTEPLRRNREVLFNLVQTYWKMAPLTRESRSLMQEYDFENIRVLSLAALKNMTALVMATSYITALKKDLSLKSHVQFDRRDISHPLPWAKPGIVRSVKNNDSPFGE